MASLPVPLPSPVSDNQFVGDLMTFFERRQLRCGTPEIFGEFASELSGSPAFCSDLFSLCSAISGMGGQELSAEQLLVLVARALNGPGVRKGSLVSEIPEGTRAAFLEGYGSWQARRETVADGSSWTALRTEALFGGARKSSEPGGDDAELAGRPAGDSLPTIQAALDLVRRRSRSGVISGRLVQPGGSSEEIAIGEVGGQPVVRAAVIPFAPAGEAGSAPVAAAEKIEEDTEAAAVELQTQTEPESRRVRVRMPVRGVVAAAALVAIGTGLAGGYIYFCLRVAGQGNQVSSEKQRAAGAGGETTELQGAVSKAAAGLQTAVASSAGLVASRSSGVSAATNAAAAKARRADGPVAEQSEQSWLPQVDQQASTRYAHPLTGQAGETSGQAGVGPGSGAGISTGASMPSQVIGLPHVSSTSLAAYELSAPRPVYPAELAKGVSGTVVVEASISRQGVVTGAWAVSGPEELRAAAIQAVRSWEFRPYLIDGSPAEVTTTLGFFFNGR